MASNKFNFRSFALMVSYVAVALVGVALLIQALLGAGQIASAVKIIADAIAYIMLAVFSFGYVKSRRHVAYLIIWIVSVVLIVLSYVLGMV